MQKSSSTPPTIKLFDPTSVNPIDLTKATSLPVDSATEKKTTSVAMGALPAPKDLAGSFYGASKVSGIPCSRIAFSEITIFSRELALEASKILKEGFATTFVTEEKPDGAQNYLTEYDTRVDKLIIERIKARFTDHGFLTEESTTEKKIYTAPNAPIVWIVDSIDGTRVFKDKVGTFSVSIAAFDMRTKQVITGVVIIPMLNELFVAERGKGAYLNEQPIHVSKECKKPQLSTGFPYSVKENTHNCIGVFSGLIGTGTPIKDLGSSVSHLAYVAAGKFDGCLHAELQPWDVAAASLLIEEAGGRISDWNGNLLSMFNETTVVAGNEALYENLIRQINEYQRSTKVGAVTEDAEGKIMTIKENGITTSYRMVPITSS